MTRFDPDALGPLLASFTGTAAPQWLVNQLGQGLGGVVYFAYNTPDVDAVAELSAQIRAAATRTPVIAIDEEGGDVTRLFARTGSPSPAAAGFGAAADAEATREHARALGRVLAACGISMNFAPVADVATNPHNPVIGTRAFGADARTVAAHAGATCEGLRDAGVLTCLKHFPGHGDTSTDSHIGLPTINASADSFLVEHVSAFSRLDGIASAVMTAHVCVPALGEGPASISPWSGALVSELLPRALVITDALDMGAITESCGFGEACVRALEAGAHLLCLGTSIRRDGEQMVIEAHDAIAAALESGRLTRSALQHRAAQVESVLSSVTAPDPVDLSAALGVYEAAGLDAAFRSARWHGGNGPVLNRGSGMRVRLADARALHDFAAGKGHNFLGAALGHLGFEIVDERADLTVVVTKHWGANAAEAERISAIVGSARTENTPVILVHAGVRDLIPPSFVENTVVSFGASRGSMEAAARLIFQWWSR